MKKIMLATLLSISIGSTVVAVAEDSSVINGKNLGETGTYTEENGTEYKYAIRKEGAAIFEITPAKGADTLNIPAEIDGIPVFRVYNGYITDAIKDIKKINIPEGVQDIKFNGAISLEEITVPSTVTRLCDGAFRGCDSLTSVTLPDTLTHIGSDCFMGCDSLKSIKIPDGVETINDYAFAECPSLEEVKWDKTADMGTNVFDKTKFRDEGEDGLLLINNDTVLYTVLGKIKTVEIPETVTRVYPEAFKDSEVEKVIWPKSLKVIGENVFFEAKKLKEVEFKGTIERIEPAAFQGCESLTSPIIPNGVTELPMLCFGYCKNIKTADIPSDIKVIEGSAFLYCTSLKELKLNEGLEEIQPDAFSYCSSLKEVIIPSTVKKIGDSSFEFCSSLEKLTVKGPATIERAAFNGTALKEENIKLADGVVYTPVKKNKRYKNDPLSFLYEYDPNAVEEELHVPRKYKDEPTARPRRTAEPTETANPKATAAPTAKPESTMKPEGTAKPEASTKPILEVKNSGGEIEVSANEKKINFTDALPFIDGNNRTQLPVRAVSESIGCKVEYDDNSRIVYITSTDENIQLKIGSEDMIVNNEVIKMDTAAQIVDDRTYIPIRYIAEALGYNVIWRE